MLCHVSTLVSFHYYSSLICCSPAILCVRKTPLGATPFKESSKDDTSKNLGGAFLQEKFS